MVLMYKPSVIESPRVNHRKRPPDGISWVQKVAAVEKWFRGSPGCFSGTWVYIGKRSTLVELHRAHEGGARPPASWKLHRIPDLYSKSPGLRLFQERSSRRFRSVWIPFDIPFLRNTEIGKKTKTGTGPPVNRLVPKII